MTVPDVLIITTPNRDYQLDNSHRCDSCGARAYYQVWLKENETEQDTRTTPKELLFCAHHWNHHRTRLAPMCMYINDESRQLRDGIRDDHWVEGQAVSLPPRKTT